MTTTRNVGIDVLRGASIIAVICYHYMLFRPLSGYGLYGVMLFFIISGYCMSPSMMACNTALDFLKKRLRRLWPTLLVCGLLTAIIEYLIPIHPDRGQGISQVFKTLLCLPTGDLPCIIGRSPQYSMIDGAYWSLKVEVKFYAILAISYFWISKKYYVQALMGIICVTGVFVAIYPDVDQTKGIFGPLYFTDSLPYLPYFLGGISIYHIRNGSRSLGIISGIYSLLALLALFGAGVNPPSMPINVTSIIAFVACMMLIAIFVFQSNYFPKFAKPLFNTIAFIGLISYPLYLLHQDIGYIAISLLWDQWWARYLVVPMTMLVAAYVVHIQVETKYLSKSRPIEITSKSGIQT